jgi:hypothetical protein
MAKIKLVKAIDEHGNELDLGNDYFLYYNNGGTSATLNASSDGLSELASLSVIEARINALKKDAIKRMGVNFDIERGK